jgi:uncharacterized protein (DUF362 family)
MTRIHRREFLRLAALGAGSAAASSLLAACGTAPEAKIRPLPPTPEAGMPYLAVARGGDDPGELVRRAIEAIGGIERFVPRGAKVLIKPNLCTPGRSYEYAATTNPWVVGAVVKLCREAGASRILVYDNPTTGSSEDAFGSSGIAEQVTAEGGKVEYSSPMKFVSVTLPGALYLPHTYVYDEVLNADVLINIPILKQHSLAQLSIGMKNLLGVIRDRPEVHPGINQKLPELAGFLRPQLTVVDAVRILTANGPTGGNLDDVRELDTVVATHDFVAADAYAATLFGLDDPNRLGYVKNAAESGLGRNDLGNLKTEEISVG